MISKITTFLLLFFVFSFLFRTDSSFDQDLGRHLKLGEIILKTHQIPKTNFFSYTNSDFPFINTHWLFEVVAYFFSKTIGLQALLFLKILIFLLSVWLIIKIIPKQNQVLLLPLGFIFLHVLRERLELRPEIFSFLFTASTYYILENFTSSLRAKRGNLLFLLPIIQLIWINTHIYFFVGLILQVIFIIHLGTKKLASHLESGELKLLGLMFVLSLILSLINPNGLLGLLYPLNVNQNYGYTIVENQTMFFLENIGFRDPNFLFVKLTGGIIILSILISLLSSRRMAGSINNGIIKNVLLSLTGLALALLNVRSFPYLVFLSLPAVLNNFGPVKKNTVIGFMFLVFSFMLLLESFFYLNNSYYRYTDSPHKVGFKMGESVKGALDFTLSHNLSQPIFNNFDIGSYIIYRGYPKYKVFVDGRPEAYPKEFFINTYIPIQYDYNKFKEFNKLMDFKTIIFSYTDQTPWAKAFLQNVVKDENWKTVYIDDFMIILLKTEDMEKHKLNSVDLSKLDPGNFSFDNHLSYLRMSIFLLNTENLSSGQNFLQKTLRIFPQSLVANTIIGNPTPNYFFW